jgi:hypothetical protein|tara:strand:- start:270 stop:515 length:246 start_codon:yes stop_codon:yes gene_type:complete
MRLLKIWLRLLNTSLTVAYYRARLLNQRILFQLDEWFSPPVSSKEISAFDEFEEDILDIEIEEEEEKKPYKPYDGPVSMTP